MIHSELGLVCHIFETRMLEVCENKIYVIIALSKKIHNPSDNAKNTMEIDKHTNKR